jgi:hypothetical protein
MVATLALRKVASLAEELPSRRWTALLCFSGELCSCVAASSSEVLSVRLEKGEVFARLFDVSKMPSPVASRLFSLYLSRSCVMLTVSA